MAGAKAALTPLETVLRKLVREADPTLVAPLEEKDWLQCFSCGHRCKIGPGRGGVCRVRYNEGGKLFVPYGYIGALQLDPIEKKPFFHVLPGSSALSFGMLGCDFHCAYCQNWITSQAIRDPNAAAEARPITPEEFVSLAFRHRAPVVTSTYNEPLITSEWAVEVFREAKRRGLLTSCVSNGNATEEVLRFIRPHVDLYKVDLKSFRDSEYRKLGGKLETVTWTIRRLVELGFWLEIVTLVVPGLNDSKEELREIARFLAGISKDIPWHVTAFHPDYKMTDREGTQARKLLEGYEIGKGEGLHYVYAGNLPGRVGQTESTFCPGCGGCLIARVGYTILENRLRDGICPDCDRRIPGVWSRDGRQTPVERASP